MFVETLPPVKTHRISELIIFLIGVVKLGKSALRVSQSGLSDSFEAPANNITGNTTCQLGGDLYLISSFIFVRLVYDQVTEVGQWSHYHNVGLVLRNFI